MCLITWLAPQLLIVVGWHGDPVFAHLTNKFNVARSIPQVQNDSCMFRPCGAIVRSLCCQFRSIWKPGATLGVHKWNPLCVFLSLKCHGGHIGWSGVQLCLWGFGCYIVKVALEAVHRAFLSLAYILCGTWPDWHLPEVFASAMSKRWCGLGKGFGVVCSVEEWPVFCMVCLRPRKPGWYVVMIFIVLSVPSVGVTALGDKSCSLMC